MSRAPLLCALLLAAYPARPAAAAAVSEDVPVPGGRAAVAAVLGLDPVPDRARFVSEAARLLYGRFDRRAEDADALALALGRLPASPAGELVPVPLTAAVWSGAIFHHPVKPAELVLAILRDRRAAFLCHGLAALDDETLQFFSDHQALLTRLYLTEAPVFAVFAGRVHVHAGHVLTPGGEGAVPLWEAVVGESAARPDRFIPALFAQAEGRTAYLYDTIGHLDRPRQRFALGLGASEPARRIAGMRALAATWLAASDEWRVPTQPFWRQPFDAATVLMRVAVDAEGRPTPPASRAFWNRALEGTDLPDDPAGLLKGGDAAGTIDAAWLVALVIGGNVRLRADRLDQFAFGQRVFADASAAEMPDVLVAVRGFRRYRMLMVTLDRMGMRRPALYAAGARTASHMAPSDPARSFVAAAQFQGALALLARMRLVGTLDQARADQLVAGLIAVPLTQYSQYLGGIVRWLRDDLAPAIGTQESIERAVLDAVSGPAPLPPAETIEWEGQRYRVDLAEGERQRLARVRDRQAGPSLDMAIDLSATAATLAGGPSATAAAQAADVQLRSAADVLRRHARRTGAEEAGLPPGVAPPPFPRDRILKALDELRKAGNPPSTSRMSRAAIEVVDAADEVAAETLVSWAYAIDIGDTDGSAFLAGDVSRRHDFGFGQRDNETRLRAPWALPRPDVAPGIAWHADGSILGLDVGLAAGSLRRLRADSALDAPTMTSNEREIFASGYGLLNPRALTDAGRDSIAAAITAGERRVRSAESLGDIDRLSDELDLDGWRGRAVRWTALHERDRLPSLFSLAELVALGGGDRRMDLDAWGTSAMISTGCMCTLMPRPGRLPLLTGRPQVGLLATAVADLNLHVARVLADLRVPARLAKYVLGAAVLDFIDEVRATDPDDWLSLVRAGAAVGRERIEDYVAAAAAGGPLVPDQDR
ncbi:MAG: hypothetical protein ABUS56_05475 [Acidobacteriota bacterium]